jgi:hypothetical protein
MCTKGSSSLKKSDFLKHVPFSPKYPRFSAQISGNIPSFLKSITGTLTLTPGDEGNKFVRNFGNVYQMTQHYVPNERGRHLHSSRKNLQNQKIPSQCGKSWFLDSSDVLPEWEASLLAITPQCSDGLSPNTTRFNRYVNRFLVTTR